MTHHATLLFTDLVDSTQLHQRIGDEAMAALWQQHDTLARALIRAGGGREVGRSDGFLVLFDSALQALAFALEYHRALAGLSAGPQARVGLHTGPVTLRQNRLEDTAQGATPYEVDGLALPVASRVMSLALAAQTLLSRETVQALPAAPQAALHSHGHWRLKGVTEPVEVFEALPLASLAATALPAAGWRPPPDSPKAYRVLRQGGGWLPLQKLPHNLPAPRDPFFGRAATLQAVVQAFDSGTRLLSLLGLGGVGKTRLALQHARAWLGDYPGGAWFCDLSAASGLDGIVFAVAQALQLPLGAADPVEQLGRAIARLSDEGPCLLVLDNFEQVARCAEASVGRWLELAPQARFIVTTRELLGVSGEQVLAVPPLTPPEALQLFQQRAQMAVGSGDGARQPLAAEDAAALPQLLDMLDCLPLAIELAAARSRLLTPRAMLQRMGDRFKLLAARHGRLDRQATMQATLDWSWDLLSTAERAVLMQLAVFDGGFEIADAEAVVDPATVAGGWVPDLLQALLEKSLLRPLQGNRLGMLRTVQEYASNRLAAAGAGGGDAERRHARHYAAQSEAEATRGRGVELDNLVAAGRRAAHAGWPEAIPLLSRAWAVLRLTGPFQTAVDLAQTVQQSMVLQPAQEALVHRVLGAAYALCGDVVMARQHLQAASSGAAALADGATWGEAEYRLAQLDLACGASDAAADRLQTVLDSAAGRDLPAVRYMALSGLAQLHFQQSRTSAAGAAYEEALAIAEALADQRWQGGTRGNLAMVARSEGRHDDARRHWQSGLLFAEGVGDRQWAGNTHCNLGLLLHEMGESDSGREHLAQALHIARAIGHWRLEATALCNLGLIDEAGGRYAQARDALTAAVACADVGGDVRLVAQARGYLGIALAALGDGARALSEVQQALQAMSVLADPGAVALAWLQSAQVNGVLGLPTEAQKAADTAVALVRKHRLHDDPEVRALLARVGERG